jgi:hypothetical protein
MIYLRTGGLFYVSIEFGITTKPVRLITMHLNDNYNKIQTGKHLSDTWECNISVANQECPHSVQSEG